MSGDLIDDILPDFVDERPGQKASHCFRANPSKERTERRHGICAHQSFGFHMSELVRDQTESRKFWNRIFTTDIARNRTGEFSSNASEAI